MALAPPARVHRHDGAKGFVTRANRLSVAMTTYNGARYLPAQLASFAAQSRLPDELVACDDGSTDDTLAILHAFGATVPFDVKVVQNAENLGHERNFAQAIDLCSGDIIFLADQDDAWNADKLAEVERAMDDDPAALLIVNDVMITDGALVPTGRTVLEQTRAAGVLGANMKSLTLGCATAFRSRLRMLVSPIPPLNYGHDSWIHDFTEILGSRRVLPRVLQLYRRHGDNVSNWAFNGPAKASPIVVMRPSAGRDLGPEYAKRVRALTLMRDRVAALGPSDYATVGAGRGYDEVLAECERAIAAVTRRSAIFGRGWLDRKWLALRLLAAGDYRYFLGVRSFAKDIIR